MKNLFKYICFNCKNETKVDVWECSKCGCEEILQAVQEDGQWKIVK